ncbi:MAG: hypothetical protein IT164_01135 [Bryobacterales bacterium]|nr:hypothetical protein [Bryobacterales bacterium]
MASNEEIYANCIARLRNRLNVIDDVLSGKLPIPHQGVLAEVIFIQFRKSLEELAFASLSANEDEYSKMHAKFSVHWRANDMLTELEKVNPGFYPVAVEAPKETPRGLKHVGRLADGFMTREEFAKLYKYSSEVLHTRNPYKEGDPTISIGYTVEEWLARFRKLLRWHFMTLVNHNAVLCTMPDQGLIHVYPLQRLP